MTDADPSEPEPDALADFARRMFRGEQGRGLFGPPNPPPEPTEPQTGPVIPKEGANPTPAPTDPIQEFARQLFNNN